VVIQSSQIRDGRWVSIVPSEARIEIPEEWADWGEMLPLVETVGELRRALIVVTPDPVAIDISAEFALAAAVGQMSWHRVSYGPNAGSQAWNFGIAILPIARGQGIGALAQRLLAQHLFATTPAFRVEASTDIENIVEQRALEERGGFRREGILRGAQYRADGVHHDMVLYAITRADHKP
jgi:RimJ/RimL family protein N-acetyltransferase